MLVDILKIGKKIYNLSNWREQHRYWVFCVRVLWHRKEMGGLYHFFQDNSVRRRILAVNPYPVEQVTRGFFYVGSTFKQRVRLICEHYEILQEKLKTEALLDISSSIRERQYGVWSNDYEGISWRAALMISPGQRKEGLLSLIMWLGTHEFYQVMFWLARGEDGLPVMYIGAMQGPNTENARDEIKKLTKRCFGYRTKNLIIYMAQAVARSLDVKKIYAVTNCGYYANNHVRRDRKLKTDFGEFWIEIGGRKTDDDRFYELPLIEQRKSIEEVKSQKRNLYRKRFVFLDSVDAGIAANMKNIIK